MGTGRVTGPIMFGSPKPRHKPDLAQAGAPEPSAGQQSIQQVNRAWSRSCQNLLDHKLTHELFLKKIKIIQKIQEIDLVGQLAKSRAGKR